MDFGEQTIFSSFIQGDKVWMCCILPFVQSEVFNSDLTKWLGYAKSGKSARTHKADGLFYVVLVEKVHLNTDCVDDWIVNGNR